MAMGRLLEPSNRFTEMRYRKEDRIADRWRVRLAEFEQEVALPKTPTAESTSSCTSLSSFSTGARLASSGSLVQQRRRASLSPMHELKPVSSHVRVTRASSATRGKVSLDEVIKLPTAKLALKSRYFKQVDAWFKYNQTSDQCCVQVSPTSSGH
eukprot:TRINITY_DN46903_c0_g1_i1.p1 TRINITY_DN46903_c0_g1~~TRINITY_DN46903_c0_g1_i1.p1  ORF type:complete len:154 (-),score=21.94 TRINITY_DN46903_c0_g1_i1:73-534(-)